MIPMSFDYEVAESVDHAIELLGEHGDESKLIAGGHSLIPLMRLRLAAPTVLIDVGRIDDLSYVRDEGDHLAIGALTRHREVHFNDLINEHCGILGYTAGLLGDPSVQHRGTLGGTLGPRRPRRRHAERDLRARRYARGQGTGWRAHHRGRSTSSRTT